MYQKVITDEKRILINNATQSLNKGIVMDEVAKDLTRTFCNIVAENRGHILDVGYGLGFSATFFREIGVKSYTCIELDDEIYTRAKQWASDKPNVTIIKGDWIDSIPTLTKKFDGIFMDTYGDVWSKYSKFESIAAKVANHGCCLSLWEYSKIRDLKELNHITVPVEQKQYELLLRPYHNVCWTYYSGNRFVKKKFYEKVTNLIKPTLCKEIIAENKIGSYEKVSAIIDDIEHFRIIRLSRLKYNKELWDIISSTFFSRYKQIAFENTNPFFVTYDEGGRYDRHVETKKHIPIGSPEQYGITIEVLLNSEFEGGDLEVYDMWLNDDRNNSQSTELKLGDAIKYSPYQHVTNKEVTKGIRYSAVIHVQNKDLVLNKTII